MTTKRCPNCKTVKARGEFYTRPNGNAHSWCSVCENKARVQRFQRDPEKQRLKVAEWRRENREHYLQYQRDYNRARRAED